MSSVIHFGINLGFAKYVSGTQAALEFVRRDLDLRVVEAVTDNDFGPALFLLDSGAFHARHRAAGQKARDLGLRIPTVFTFYRDGGAVAHPDPAVRFAARTVLSSLAHQAQAMGAQYACAALMTADRDHFAANPDACTAQAFGAWRSWMEEALAIGLAGLVLEMSAQAREDCATVAQTRSTLDRLRQHHEANPETTVPVHLCYDLGHGISPAEAPADAERDYRAWFRAFSGEILEVHVKNTDARFLATWPFTSEFEGRGIIDPDQVVAAVRDLLERDVLLMLEIAGKRGREIGEQAILKDLAETVVRWKRALRSARYQEREDGAWELAG